MQQRHGGGRGGTWLLLHGIGAFTELGPFYPTGDGRELRNNSKSWNKVSNLLFVEAPAGVGWSYSNNTSDYISGDASNAKDLLTFMLNWYKKFPALKTRNLFLSGESYAGHYIPQMVIALLDYNARSTGFKFNIKGLALGNPLLRLNTDASATYDYFWSHGMISDELQDAITNNCDFGDYVYDSTIPQFNVSSTCEEAIVEAKNIVGNYTNQYDVILDVCYPSFAEQQLRLRKLATKMSRLMFAFPMKGTSNSTFRRFRRLCMRTGLIFHTTGLCAATF